MREAYERYLEDWDERGAPWDYWVEKSEDARNAFAGLVNADADEVAVTTSVSAGLSAIATGLRYARRSKIVTTDWEFPTVGQIWHAQELRGARVVHIEADADGTLPLERFEREIDEDTAIVSVTHVCYRNGARVESPRSRGSRTSAARSSFSTRTSPPARSPSTCASSTSTFSAAGALKYLLGSAGLAFLYARREVVERVWPTATGWFADKNIFEMDHRDYSPAPTASRFQSGTPPIPAIYAGVAGIELMQEIGVADTRRHVNELNARLIEGLDELGAQIATPRRPKRRGALICVAFEGRAGARRALGREGIVTSDRDGNLRVSAHAYNSVDDVDELLAALERHEKLLA